MTEYKSGTDGIMRGFYITIAVIVVVFVVFITTVVIPSNENRRKDCEAKGGVLVGKYHDCIKKEYVL